MLNSTHVILQINASDERSAAAIETRILDVVQMNSVTADSRPKCLVSLTYSVRWGPSHHVKFSYSKVKSCLK